MTTEEIKRRSYVINPLQLIKQNIRIPLLVIELLAITGMILGSGLIQLFGFFINAMYGGILVYGYLIDPKYLNEQGRNKSAVK